MAGVKISQLPLVISAQTTDLFPAVQAGVTSGETLAQVRTLFGFSSGILLPANGGTGIANTGTITVGGNTAFSGAFTFVGTITGNTTVTFPTSGTLATTAQIPALPVSPTNGGTGVSNPTAHTIPIAEGASNYTFLALTTGQLLIGSTGADPVPATLTAGTGISISNGAGAITINGTGGGVSWTDVTGTTQTMVSNNGYVADNAGLVTLTLPATSSFGDRLAIVGKGAGGWTIAQGAGQIIHIGASASTSGAGGSIASTNQWDSLQIVCVTANTVWACVGGPQGNLTIV